jgi:hypothetical protein
MSFRPARSVTLRTASVASHLKTENAEPGLDEHRDQLRSIPPNSRVIMGNLARYVMGDVCL